MGDWNKANEIWYKTVPSYSAQNTVCELTVTNMMAVRILNLLPTAVRNDIRKSTQQ
jgi:hypothetical protein